MSAKRNNPFEAALAEQEALFSVQPLPHALVQANLDSLERTGFEHIGAGNLKTARFAEAMHGVFMQVSDLEVVPPFNEEQAQEIAGKVATYAAMQEAATPKKTRAARKTETKQAKTDQAKS